MTNFKKLDGSHYLVRTQAGYKQAEKDWLNGDTNFYRSRSSAHPKSYPSVVRFMWFYEGATVLLALSEHANAFRARMNVFMANLDAADPVQGLKKFEYQVTRNGFPLGAHDLFTRGFSPLNDEQAVEQFKVMHSKDGLLKLMRRPRNEWEEVV